MDRQLPFDPRLAVRTLSRADPMLAGLMRQVGPLRLSLRDPQSPFEALAQSIVYQQLHGKAAATIFARVKASLPRGRLTPQALLAAPVESLRAAGLSASKLAAMRDLAAKTLDGTVPRSAQLA